MRDIVLVSIPYIEYTLPPAAPAILKGCLKSHGFDAFAFDLNIDFRNRWGDRESLEQVKEYWTTKKNNLGNLKNLYDSIVSQMASELVALNTTWIGISVFTQMSQQFCMDLVDALNLIPTRGKIVLGGNGVSADFAFIMESKVDAWIQGEGEVALVELLRGNMLAPGIKKTNIQLENLNDTGIADYADYNLQAGYDNFYDSPAVQINGSRGCVRNCSFCNVADLWPKFRYRSGKLIAEEIIKIHQDTGIVHFFFTDSLINGNMRELMLFMNDLADYREANNVNITWGGQWIARKQKGLPKNYYELIKRSGGFNLTIGVETGSDSVREHMKKGFTNEDLDSEIEQFSKHGIRCGFLMMVGYPTETEEDFNSTLDLFWRYTKYVADGTIIGVAMGRGFMLEKNTPIVVNEHKKTWALVDHDEFRWYSLKTNASFVENIRRRMIAEVVLSKLGWPANNPEKDLLGMVLRLQNMINSGLSVPDYITVNKDLSVDPKFYIDYTPGAYTIEFDITGFPGTQSPEVEISINNQLLYKGTIIGQTKLDYTINNSRKRQMLKIKLLNGGDGCRIEFNEFKIAGVRLRKDSIWLKGRTADINGNVYNSNAIWTNSTWHLYFENSPIYYFLKQNNYYYSGHSNLRKKYVQRVLDFYKNL